MERISVRGLAAAIRLIREPVVVTYSYPRNHPLYSAGEECGVFVPMPLWKEWEQTRSTNVPWTETGPEHPANDDLEFIG